MQKLFLNSGFQRATMDHPRETGWPPHGMQLYHFWAMKLKPAAPCFPSVPPDGHSWAFPLPQGHQFHASPVLTCSLHLAKQSALQPPVFLLHSLRTPLVQRVQVYQAGWGVGGGGWTLLRGNPHACSWLSQHTFLSSFISGTNEHFVSRIDLLLFTSGHL